ncbi:hypothetical protein DFH08DRAFT_978313 [Mycena albidolilacea]|uniref:Uncharacterized protein n=1 Tax=Mycena albidolilacea TaxID=1033008 RepID=A0AAD6YZ44_9AGAR|nr:hypothetical protein DFH08DRAFT_978313 [Mycena albidolilacea]
MSPVLHPEVAHNLCYTTHLVLGKGLDPFINPQLFCRWLRLFPSVRQVSWDDPPEVAHNLCYTTHLVLGKGLDPFINPQLFCRWLRLFLSVRQVSWDDPTPWLVAPINIPFLARQISRGCPRVEMIIVPGVRHSISAILTSMETVEVSNAVASQFVELPTEVLLLVFDLLGNALFSLATLYRRLDFLALPIFLERHSIHDPSTRLYLGWMPSLNVIVHALTVAIFIPSESIHHQSHLCVPGLHIRASACGEYQAVNSPRAAIDDWPSLNFLVNYCPSRQPHRTAFVHFPLLPDTRSLPCARAPAYFTYIRLVSA